MLYDSLLLMALWIPATALAVAVVDRSIPSGTIWLQLYLLVIAWAYFALSWRKGGTLGMAAWRITIDAGPRPPDWRQTIIRFVMAGLSWAAFGLGFAAALWHPEGATWHDRASGTRLRYRPRIRPLKG